MDYTRIIRELDRIHVEMTRGVGFAQHSVSSPVGGIHYAYGAALGTIKTAQMSIEGLVDTLKEMEAK